MPSLRFGRSLLACCICICCWWQYTRGTITCLACRSTPNAATVLRQRPRLPIFWHSRLSCCIRTRPQPCASYCCHRFSTLSAFSFRCYLLLLRARQRCHQNRCSAQATRRTPLTFSALPRICCCVPLVTKRLLPSTLAAAAAKRERHARHVSSAFCHSVSKSRHPLFCP